METTLLGLHPVPDHGVFVRGILVHDPVHAVILRHLFFQVVEEADEFLGSFADPRLPVLC
jgi:hypothetical protein